MSAVDAAAIRSDRHLFAHGSAQSEGPPTVSPNEVVISSSYSPGVIHPSVLEEGAALHHDKDFEPLDLSHDPSIQPDESTAASIQALDEVPDHIGVTIEDMVSSDDSQDWTEGDSQEHKRVKVCPLLALQPIPPVCPDSVRRPSRCSSFLLLSLAGQHFVTPKNILDSLSDSVARSMSLSALIGRTKAPLFVTDTSMRQPMRLN